MTIIVMGSLRFPPDMLEKVKPYLRILVEATRQHDGCLAYDVAEDLFDPGLIRFSEAWPSEDLLQRHLKAPHIAPWREKCAEFGLLERRFTAYTGSNAHPV